MAEVGSSGRENLFFGGARSPASGTARVARPAASRGWRLRAVATVQAAVYPPLLNSQAGGRSKKVCRRFLCSNAPTDHASVERKIDGYRSWHPPNIPTCKSASGRNQTMHAVPGDLGLASEHARGCFAYLYCIQAGRRAEAPPTVVNSTANRLWEAPQRADPLRGAGPCLAPVAEPNMTTSPNPKNHNALHDFRHA